MENKMQVIISTAIRFNNEADVAAYKALSFEALSLEDLEFNEVTRYIVGYEHIVLFGQNGRRLAVLKRDKVRGMAINDKPVKVNGDGFKPFNTEDDELNALKEELAALGHGGDSRSSLKKYLEVNKSGLPVVVHDDMTEDETAFTIFSSITELFKKWPAVDVHIDDEPVNGRWEVGISD